MPPPINLLPPELRTQRRARQMQSIVVLAGVLLLVILAIVTVVQRAKIRAEEDELTALQADVTRLKGQVAQLQQFADLESQVKAKKATLATALTGDVAWSKFMNDLALIMPDNSWLTGSNLTAAAATSPSGVPAFGTVTFQGFVFDFTGLAGWLTRMSQIEGLNFVYLNNGTKQQMEGRDVVAFGANASIVQGLLSMRCQSEAKPCP